jgi:alkanesulfonate monooxygenase SsuD/methylene tetrahydromethanopterin reductase-like flavin-dependent oxidoreductase (luciferase family)
MAGLPVLPPTYQQPHPPIWVACLLSPESFEWTAQGYHLLYVAYHVDYPLAVERIGWLRNHGRRIEGSRGLLRLPAHFIASDDDDALQRIVHQPMTEYAAPASKRRASRPTRPPTRATSSATPASASSSSSPIFPAAF